uniref:Gamma-aminobutyric acid receptor subunit alpha-6 n=1 Tax=Macrostomum lignano TaxID=282301 RepID=A0A1I8IYR8_9PLAT
KLKVRLWCMMDLRDFPLDCQTCRIEMGAYGSSVNEVRFHWFTTNVTLEEDAMQIPEFSEPSISVKNCTKSFSVTGEFACLRANIRMRRSFGFYLMNTYAPFTLMVCISWAGFWIDARATPARVTISFLTVLAVVTQNAGAQMTGMPRVSYAKAIDLFMMASLMFVIAALLEFAAASFLARQRDKPGLDGGRIGTMLFNSGSLQHPLVCLAIILALPIGSPCSAMLYTAGVNHTEMTKNITETLNRLLDNYDKNLRPDFDAQPVTVRINMNNRSVGPISEKSMIFSFDCYFRQEWMDARLTFPTHHNFSHLQLNEKMLRDIWKPDTYFVNGMGSYLHNITSPNVLFRINSTGHILYSMRLTIKANCPMNLLKFPMDTQVCPLVVSSHGYTEADVVYEWSKGDESIQLNKDLLLSQFDLRSESAVLCLGLCDKLYLPCSLLVVLSWVGFWINREATSDRIALSITTVLTMTFLGMDNRQDLPRVSYGTALDWYVGMCFAQILATIIEFASVHYFTKHGSGETHVTLETDGAPENGGLRYGQATPRMQRPQPPQLPDLRAAAQVADRPPSHDSCPYAFLNCIKGSSKYKELKLMRSTKTVNS